MIEPIRRTSGVPVFAAASVLLVALGIFAPRPVSAQAGAPPDTHVTGRPMHEAVRLLRKFGRGTLEARMRTVADQSTGHAASQSG